MSDNVMQPPLVVELADAKYTFRMPSILHDVEVAYRAADIRRRAPGGGMGDMFGLDNAAVQFSRAAAYLELYLVSATVTWPWGGDTSKKPKVQAENWTFDRINTVYQLGGAFETELSRFRQPGPADGSPAATEAVAGVNDSGAP